MSATLAKRSPLWLVAWPFQHIRWKIVLPYAFLTVLLAVVGSYLATQLVTGSLEERFDNQLAEAGRSVSDRVVLKEREHLETVRAVSFTAGVADAIQTGDQGSLDSLVRPIAANAAVERVEVLDAQGARLAALRLADPEAVAYEPVSDADTPAQWPLVQRALQGQADGLGDKYAQIIDTADGLVLWTAGPVFADSGQVGVVLVGTYLDSFIKQTKAEALADVTVYDFEGTPLASTFAAGQGLNEEGDLRYRARGAGPIDIRFDSPGAAVAPEQELRSALRPSRTAGPGCGSVLGGTADRLHLQRRQSNADTGDAAFRCWHGGGARHRPIPHPSIDEADP